MGADNPNALTTRPEWVHIVDAPNTYRGTHHGGLTIGDEIQVGYARLGTWFWGFQQQGVVPDIVIVAKAAGNGHPVGAVITSKRTPAWWAPT
jgi:4-aminobutyrate aminotransferase-like enzyme